MCVSILTGTRMDVTSLCHDVFSNTVGIHAVSDATVDARASPARGSTGYGRPVSPRGTCVPTSG